MDQLDRIRAMEEILRRGEAALDRFEEAWEDFAALQGPLKTLDAYYGSRDWFFDLESDEAGLLPDELPRGVLSEDGIYDLLTRNRELLAAMGALLNAETPNAEAGPESEA